MESLFDPNKATQIMALLLSLNNNEINYTKAIKLIYIADRDFLKEYKIPISFDVYVSMDNGPVLSNIYDLVKGKETNPYWSEHIEKNNYSLKLIKNPGYNLLSNIEVDTLSNINLEFKSYDYSDMIQYTHKKCKEWKDPEGSSLNIKLDELLIGIGKNEDEIESIKEDLAYLQTLRSVFPGQ